MVSWQGCLFLSRGMAWPLQVVYQNKEIFYFMSVSYYSPLTVSVCPPCPTPARGAPPVSDAPKRLLAPDIKLKSVFSQWWWIDCNYCMMNRYILKVSQIIYNYNKSLQSLYVVLNSSHFKTRKIISLKSVHSEYCLKKI